jgi:hypothetical protein
MDELQGVLEREVRELARGVLRQPERTSLDRSAEADAGARVSCHERMFSPL